MGLVTTHGAWDGKCSLFNVFRKELARRIEIDLNQYFGYNPEGTKHLSTIEHPLRYLFNLPDSYGELSSSECCLVGFGIEQVMNAIPLDDLINNIIIDQKNQYTMQDFYQDCDQFKRGCIAAFTSNESLVFNL